MIPLLRCFKLALLEVTANRARSLMMVLCVTAAVATMTVVTQMAASAEQELQETITRTQGLAGTVETSVPDAPIDVQFQILSPVNHPHAAGRTQSLGYGELKLVGKQTPYATSVASIAGVDPGVLATFPNSLKSGRWLTASDADLAVIPAVLSAQQARTLQNELSISSEIEGTVLEIEYPYPVLLEVVGVLDDGAFTRKFNDSGIFVPLTTLGVPSSLLDWSFRAQEGGPGAVRLFLNDPAQVQKLMDLVRIQLAGSLEAVGVSSESLEVMRVDSSDDFSAATRTLNLILNSIGVAVLLIGITAVSIVSMMSLRERAGELALRRSMGATPKSIANLVLMENFVVILVGTTAGILTSIGLTMVLENTPIGGMAGGINRVEPVVALTTLGIALVFGVFLSLVPAHKASKQDIMDVLTA